jgi:hypothetical protein
LRHQRTAGRMASGLSGPKVGFGIRTRSAPEGHSRPKWPTGNYDSVVPNTEHMFCRSSGDLDPRTTVRVDPLRHDQVYRLGD